MVRSTKVTLGITAKIKDEVSGVLGRMRRAVGGVGKSMVERFRGIGRAILSAKTALLAFVGIFVAGRLASAVRELAAANDEVGKLAQSLKISVEEASKLQFAFESAGVGGQGALETILTALERQRATAIRQPSAQRDAFAQLGITLQELKTLNASELLRALAAGMERFGSRTEAAAQLQVILTDNFRKLLPLLAEGTAEYDALIARAERYGTISQRVANISAAFNDATLDLSGAFRQLKNEILEQIGPTLISGIKAFGEFIIENKDEIVRGLKDILTAIADLALGIVELVERISNFVGDPKGFLGARADQLGRLNDVSRELRANAKALQDLGVVDATFSPGRQVPPISFRDDFDIEKRSDEFRRRVEQLQRERSRLLGEFAEIERQEQEQLGGRIADSIRKRIREIRRGLTFGAGGADPSAVDDTAPGFFEGFGKAIEDVGDQLRDFFKVGQDVARQLASSMSSRLAASFEAIALGTKKAKDAFRDMARSILADLARISSKLLADQLLGALIGAITSGIAAGAGSGATPGGGTRTGHSVSPGSGGAAGAGLVPEGAPAGGGGGRQNVFIVQATDPVSFIDQFEQAVARSPRMKAALGL